MFLIKNATMKQALFWDSVIVIALFATVFLLTHSFLLSLLPVLIYLVAPTVIRLMNVAVSPPRAKLQFQVQPSAVLGASLYRFQTQTSAPRQNAQASEPKIVELG